MEDPSSLWHKYVASLYWAFSTMTTVGYGDIVPISTAETVYCVFGMIVGATVFGYIVGSVASLISSIKASATRYEDRMEEVTKYMQDRHLPKYLWRRVKAYYMHYLSRKSAFDEDTILLELSDALRREVVLHLNKDIIDRIPFFANSDESFVTHIVSLLRPQFCAPRVSSNFH